MEHLGVTRESRVCPVRNMDPEKYRFSGTRVTVRLILSRLNTVPGVTSFHPRSVRIEKSLR